MKFKLRKRLKAVAIKTWESVAPELNLQEETVSNLFVIQTVLQRGNMEEYGNDPDVVERFRKLPLETQYQILIEQVFTDEEYEL